MTLTAKSNCRYLIMAGGTGGHIFPAMAVAKSLQDRGAEVHWLGTIEGMEYHLVAKENLYYGYSLIEYDHPHQARTI